MTLQTALPTETDLTYAFGALQWDLPVATVLNSTETEERGVLSMAFKPQDL
jgi:hypothetical protein